MRVIETLSEEEKLTLVNGSAVGIFTTLILNTDDFYIYSRDLCLSYYFQHSNQKTVSKIYTTTEEVISNSSLTIKPNEVIGKVIRSKFIDKWNRVYNSLIKEQYSVLDNNSFTEHKAGNNTENITYNNQLEENGDTQTNVTTTNTSENANDVYGFNSSGSVGTDTSTSTDVEVVTGDSDNNTTHSIKTKTGTDDKTFTNDEDTTRSGRDTSGADLIQRELSLRNKYNFFDIVFNDIDSVLTLQIYNRGD